MFDCYFKNIKEKLAIVKTQEDKADDTFRYVDEQLKKLKVETEAYVDLIKGVRLEYNLNYHDRDNPWCLRIRDLRGFEPIRKAKRNYKLHAINKLEVLLDRICENIEEECDLFKNVR